MSFRYLRNKSHKQQSEQLKNQLNNWRLYHDLRSLATLIMCGVFNLSPNNIERLEQHMHDYRDNVLDCLMRIIIYDKTFNKENNNE